MGPKIRELLAIATRASATKTLAEARLYPGGSTTPHHHLKSEENLLHPGR